ncbi:hypothetical protein C8E89_14815 [Mycolicibacterium moriokaense]|uniref:Uncharacterized protein n=1 Tax=Mycolicibacterium moriokaense TaxID=39691 RepID=A0A318H340_9MYCO|nr:hypothetical protein C8E89_14815 [Mycolicibacterium moriokaense]
MGLLLVDLAANVISRYPYAIGVRRPRPGAGRLGVPPWSGARWYYLV